MLELDCPTYHLIGFCIGMIIGIPTLCWLIIIEDMQKEKLSELKRLLYRHPLRKPWVVTQRFSVMATRLQYA